MIPPKPRRADVQRLERMCSALPEVVITRHDPHSGFEVRGKKFAWHVVDEHGDGRIALICKAVRGENEVLVASDPTRFFLPKYMAHHGWIGLYLDVGAIDWDEVHELVTDAYLLTAPKKLAAQLDQA
ncbi:MAG: MmcQ/YjbR family DNA-binding protein [Acidimicrobiales bacterium]